MPELVLALTARGVRLTKVNPHDRTLEELYFAVRAPHIAAAPSDGGLMPEAASRPDSPTPRQPVEARP